MTIHAATTPELNALRGDQQWSRLFLAGMENPPVVFACQVNQVFSTHDKVAQVAFDNVTAGVYTDVLPGMTVWIGDAPGLYNIGQARVRKSATSALLYIGEESEVNIQDNYYLTVVDEMGIWVKHPNGLNMDYDVAYSNQHTVFEPVVCMGANMVKDVSAYPVTVTFPDAAAGSRVFGGAIATWAWTASAGVLTGGTTNNPTLTINSYPANGLIRVALTLTSAAGKSFTGYRYTRVYDATHRPITEFNSEGCDATVDSGGFNFTVTMYGEAAKSSIRDRAPVTLFADDYYGGTKVSLGQAAGRANIVCSGWVVGESIDYDPIAGSVKFSVAGAQYWLDKISAFPLVLEIPKKSPTKWNQMPGLTVDLALWHLFHWRSTVSAIADTLYTDDTRMTPKMETVTSSLWEQSKKICKRIFATCWVDQYGNFSVNVLPQMVAEADRDYAVIQEITKRDWVDKIDIQRRVVTEAAMVSLTAKQGNASGGSVSYYSLANGHIYKRHGNPEMIDDVMADSQAQANELAGLYCGWKNNELPTINIKLAANNRLITLFPNQFLNITIDAADNERGISYTGNLVLRGVSFVWDSENYILLTEISCEAETFAEPAINGDIPNDASGVDMSIPPVDVEMPAMPALPSLVLPPSMANANHPTDVVIVSSTHGVLYTTNFDEEEPEWKDMNAGLSSTEYNRIGKIVATPSGKLFIMCDGTESGGYTKIYYANALGGAWRLLKQADNRSGDSTSTGIFHALGVSPMGEQIAVLGSVDYVYYQWHTIGRLLLGNSNGISIAHYPMTFYRQLNALLWTQSGWNIFCDHIAGPILAPWGVGALFNSLDPTAPPEGIQSRFDLAINSAKYYGCGCGSLKTQFYWSGGVGGYGKTDGASDAYSTGINPNGVQAMAAAPTANKLMASNYAGGNYQAYRSPDGGDTWELLTAVIPLGMSVFENCGDDFRWIFGGGTNLKLTVNFGDLDPNDGTSYYANKEGNLGYVAPLINIKQIRYIKG